MTEAPMGTIVPFQLAYRLGKGSKELRGRVSVIIDGGDLGYGHLVGADTGANWEARDPRLSDATNNGRR